MMNHGDTRGIYLVTQIPREMIFATGAIFTLFSCIPLESGNADLTGTKVMMEVVVTPLKMGSGPLDDSAFLQSNAVAAQSNALPQSLGLSVVQEITVPVGKLGGLQPGDVAFIRVRRMGTDAKDTNRGWIVFVMLSMRNT